MRLPKKFDQLLTFLWNWEIKCCCWCWICIGSIDPFDPLFSDWWSRLIWMNCSSCLLRPASEYSCKYKSHYEISWGLRYIHILSKQIFRLFWPLPSSQGHFCFLVLKIGKSCNFLTNFFEDGTKVKIYTLWDYSIFTLSTFDLLAIKPKLN